MNTRAGRRERSAKLRDAEPPLLGPRSGRLVPRALSIRALPRVLHTRTCTSNQHACIHADMSRLVVRPSARCCAGCKHPVHSWLRHVSVPERNRRSIRHAAAAGGQQHPATVLPEIRAWWAGAGARLVSHPGCYSGGSRAHRWLSRHGIPTLPRSTPKGWRQLPAAAESRAGRLPATGQIRQLTHAWQALHGYDQATQQRAQRQQHVLTSPQPVPPPLLRAGRLQAQQMGLLPWLR